MFFLLTNTKQNDKARTFTNGKFVVMAQLSRDKIFKIEGKSLAK